MSRHQPYRPPLPQIPADPLCGNPFDSRDPRSHVPPLKGLRETLTASVSYRASVPAGHAYCEVAPSHRALVPAADRQNGSFKALSGKGSVPASPPPFRHTPGQSRPRHTAPVWRNLGRHPHRDGTFTFSAKEKDLETGLSYFGSRYYSSDLSIWLSVDPMAAKYPSLSPYVYCANNPIKLVDPNGEEINPIFNKSGKYVGKTTDEAKNRSAIIMDGYSKENYPNGITVSQATSKNAGGVFLNEYKEGINISDQEWDKAVAEGGERMFPFVENHSNETIYFKPERSKGEGDNRVENDGAYPLGAGKDLYMPVDGVATSKYNDNVGKIPTGATIKITKEGGLNIDFHGFGGLIRLFPDYGWVNHNWQKKQQRGGDYSWDKLFNKAGQIGRRPY